MARSSVIVKASPPSSSDLQPCEEGIGRRANRTVHHPLIDPVSSLTLQVSLIITSGDPMGYKKTVTMYWPSLLCRRSHGLVAPAMVGGMIELDDSWRPERIARVVGSIRGPRDRLEAIYVHYNARYIWKCDACSNTNLTARSFRA